MDKYNAQNKKSNIKNEKYKNIYNIKGKTIQYKFEIVLPLFLNEF